MTGVRLPSPQNRTAVIGSTGSGKTQLACWLLSTRDFNSRPWVIFDFKGDSLIEKINPLEISIFGNPPTKPGLYVVRPIPDLHDDAVTDFLWKCWAQGHIGIYIDEGFMIGNRNPAFNACLTQGRSKYIEMIILSQRPVWMSKFVFSEANFFAVMRLTIKGDQKTVGEYLGDNRINSLPQFHSFWYDVERQSGVVFEPVPDQAQILRTFEQRLNRKRKVI
jgi:DNA helicase HerA-like ATPase